MNKIITLTSDLSRLRVHPKENHIFSCGGKEHQFAKNENDFLDLKVPVWITDLQFLNDSDTTKLVIGSKYHQIRIYDTKAKRRPVQDFNIGVNPVVSLIMGRNSNEIIFSDTVGSVSSVDIRTGKILGRYKDKKSTSLVTVCLDRFLRVHEMNATRKLTHKIYLKQRQTCVLVGSSEG
ncbi:1401_t:CDS:2 [Diversispora eburnea]|uniref:Ribosome biogenesis protein NSA1 n=1 Tax=Diversispora eburnea TaxID=1213867 RepID=A0A9N8WN50_9GLOM|nr:1401_t:CDS:2 [Diversispora eburnea]